MRAELRLGELAGILRDAGASKLELTVAVPNKDSLRMEPPLARRDSLLGGSWFSVAYDVDRLPARLSLDTGFEATQVWSLAGGVFGLLLLPILLALLRPKNLLELSAASQALFLIGLTGWTWVLLESHAVDLLDFVFRGSRLAPFLALTAPPLLAVWLAIRASASHSVRLSVLRGSRSAYQRRAFWIASVLVIVSSTLFTLFTSSSESVLPGATLGLVLTFVLVIVLYASRRGGSQSLAAGELRTRITTLAGQAGVTLRDVLILTSPEPRPPVAMAGRWGVVILNDGVLRELSRREVDAVVCHELAHLRTTDGGVRMILSLVVVVTAYALVLVPGVRAAIPLGIPILFFAFKAWRRSKERQADAESMRWGGDPEALATALARVSRLHALPLVWSTPASWFMAHPSTMERIRILAHGRISDARVKELIAESATKAVDRYDLPSSPLEGAAFSSELRRRLQATLSLYGLIFPAIFGVGVAWLLRTVGLGGWLLLAVGTPVSMLAFYLGYEAIVGGARSKIRDRAASVYGNGHFVGLALAAEPRIYDGMYQYDYGFIRLAGELLEYSGDRARFALDRRQVQRVWIGCGPRHWTPRPTVCLDCQPATDGPVVTISLQSFEARSWPGTRFAARRLMKLVEDWHRSGAPPEQAVADCEIPRVPGTVDSGLSARSAFRIAAIYGVAGFVTGVLAGPFITPDVGDIVSTLYPGFLSASVALFAIWPRINWTVRTPRQQPANAA